jgi:primosomal protein N' (replication factor Y) (superfamily II helicase)
MFYYQTFVNDLSYKGLEPLTYSSGSKIAPGTIVRIPLKNNVVLGLVYKETPKPKFNTKPVEQVLDLPALPLPIIRVAEWMLSYYPTSVGVLTQHFIPKSLSKELHYDIPSSVVDSTDTEPAPPLTTEQQTALRTITKPGTYLLHGETGSGKTRVYIELAARTLDSGKSAIILTPEIGLTPQLAHEFYEAFGARRVVVTHSQLTEKERKETWMRILLAKTPLVVIGPRSALFSPIRDLGLIILDESHETSYKQDQSPHYHASKVAAQYAAICDIPLVLGSGTPSITDYFLAQTKQRPIIRMHAIARSEKLYKVKTTVVDIKDRTQFGRSQHISNELLEAVSHALSANEQSLLFLNRRGTARIVLCQQCGWQALCPRCDLPLTYHGDSHTLRCHTCGYSSQPASSCPICHGSDIVLKSIGTKAIAEEIATIFPHARIRRFDTDNKKSERIEQHYHDVRDGKVDILVGTQLLVKGFDLPKLSVVGAIAADTSLYFPDYTAQERTYQLLRQVIGRVGRGHRDGVVIVQTYDPTSVVVNAATAGNWDEFYAKELDERNKFMFPPFCFLLKLSVRRATANSAKRAAEKLVDILRDESLRVVIDGPSPSFHEKQSNKYQWQVIVKAKDRKELQKVIAQLPSGWAYDIDPINLL